MKVYKCKDFYRCPICGNGLFINMTDVHGYQTGYRIFECGQVINVQAEMAVGGYPTFKAVGCDRKLEFITATVKPQENSGSCIRIESDNQSLTERMAQALMEKAPELNCEIYIEGKVAYLDTKEAVTEEMLESHLERIRG